ncbi:uncharacterized protein CTHT_0017630 [Thermochaetoides thermophila DSM 1495]|uniref:DUF8004 domain-containing protein n=1 Tax=Chaetomium thermophilum (strain DSM 1495 / CBS 144.50 / IMI 039719) TaxID=759272 RepID=G0S2L3_CHATD|nr:hypothetical protein CTHT_0017630 [Thermochaetoides thermophila DSM 1495]EGS22246.1 hypothetical protein CTHT_0017630 [Thermochaetoides thermophila DSM 1495]
MSGRSAYVRKKINEPTKGGRARAKSNASSSDNATINDYPIAPVPPVTYGSQRDPGLTRIDSNAPYYYGEEIPAYPQYPTHAGPAQIARPPSRRAAPAEHVTYVRVVRPVIPTSEVSGIEKSGLRSVLDKKSSEVRNGLAKAFTFKKGDKKAKEVERPPSSAVVRPSRGAGVVPKSPHDVHPPDISPTAIHPGPVAPQGHALSPVPEATPQPIGPSVMKRWIGGGRPVQRWNKLRKDPELWDPNGDVLVYFGQKGQGSLNPSFRLSSHIIEATESRYLVTLLREGLTDEDVNMPFSQQQHLGSGGYGRTKQPTPPASEDNSICDADGQISYEMYFPPPPNMSPQEQLRHNITTRNVFALLYHASLVGFSLYQALSDLHTRLIAWMPPESDNVGTIIKYLTARGLDDVRNDPETAVGLLAWSEGSDVRWEEGWRESFLHCAGLYSRLEKCADFTHVTPVTKALLERASLETQLRVQAAEERLAAFEFGDMWPSEVAVVANPSGPVTASPAKAAADRLQKFFLQHYTREFGTWPPAPVVQPGARQGEGEQVWLTRTVAQVLQKDFAALYDYLVNRDVIWDESEARPSRKWMMVSKSGNRDFEADTSDLPMTDMLIEFDNKHRYPHIPHPYPLVPESIPPTTTSSNSSTAAAKPASGIGSLFPGRSGNKPSPPNTGTNTPTSSSTNVSTSALERRVQLAYTEATNLCTFGSDFAHSRLTDAFAKFERSDMVGEIDPATARRGRWIVIYGVLQTLATVAVDSPGVRYSEGVAYHLSVRMRGQARLPPWKTRRHGLFAIEASHELSHCWVVVDSWEGGLSPGGGIGLANGGESSADEDALGTSPVDSRLHHRYHHDGFDVPYGSQSLHFPSVPRGTMSSTTTGSSGTRRVPSNSSRGGPPPRLRNRPPTAMTYATSSTGPVSSAASVISHSSSEGQRYNDPWGSHPPQLPPLSALVAAASASASARATAIPRRPSATSMGTSPVTPREHAIIGSNLMSSSTRSGAGHDDGWDGYWILSGTSPGGSTTGHVPSRYASTALGGGSSGLNAVPDESVAGDDDDVVADVDEKSFAMPAPFSDNERGSTRATTRTEESEETGRASVSEVGTEDSRGNNKAGAGFGAEGRRLRRHDGNGHGDDGLGLIIRDFDELGVID